MQTHSSSRAFTDASLQKQILNLTLATYPMQVMTTSGIAQRIDDQEDVVEQAVRVLMGVGLLDPQDLGVRPSAAALHFEQLVLYG